MRDRCVPGSSFPSPAKSLGTRLIWHPNSLHKYIAMCRRDRQYVIFPRAAHRLYTLWLCSGLGLAALVRYVTTVTITCVWYSSPCNNIWSLTPAYIHCCCFPSFLRYRSHRHFIHIQIIGLQCVIYVVLLHIILLHAVNSLLLSR